ARLPTTRRVRGSLLAKPGTDPAVRLNQYHRTLQNSGQLTVLAVLPDGSHLTRFRGLRVRIIEADITLTTSNGQRITGHYRLATTLLDHRHDPAEALIRLYHERWEIESAFYSLRHTLLTGRVLRSQDPRGLEQEVWALLTLYQVIRMAMVEAVESVPGADPDRARLHRCAPGRPRPGHPRGPHPADLIGLHHERHLHRGPVRSAAAQTRTHQHPQGEVPDLPLSGEPDQRAPPDQPKK
ncbi:transposase, partial [Streptomyces sp. NPDC000349]|uniref:transposase n=1 Tax=Streptomyces sp. NPDC000349 TaxID=3154249 RepID=UPI00336A7187